MKKVFAILLTCIFLCALTVYSFADIIIESNTPTGKNVSGGNVTAFYQVPTQPQNVYSVDIIWTEEAVAQNPEATGTLSEADTASWTENNATVTVTNHSNAGITATTRFDQVQDETKATVTVGNVSDIVMQSAPNGGDKTAVTLNPSES